VVSNLPYNVGTALLIKWLTGPWTPASMTLMFQKEVAQRIAAPVDGDAYGRLAVIAQATCAAQTVMDVPARAFTPPPKVESAVVRLTPRSDRPAPARLDALQKVTAAAFGQRRKMLRASLKGLGGEALIAAASLDPQARAETVDVDGFLRLADAWLAARATQAPGAVA
jgi:16S rRNA (adenine1518-N6/adenine1519-N6)-dimethyltransferase